MMKPPTSPVTQCRKCGASVDVRLVQCPECGSCCPGCSASGLKVERKKTSPERRAAMASSSPCGKLVAMHEELGHALLEAMWEMDNLPADPDAAISRLFAVADDLEDAIGRMRELETVEVAGEVGPAR